MFKRAYKFAIVQTVLHTSSHVCVVRPAINDSSPPLSRSARLILCTLNGTIEQAVRYICIITVSDDTANKPAGARYICRYTTVLDFVTLLIAGYFGDSYKTCREISTLDATLDVQVLDGTVFYSFEQGDIICAAHINIDCNRMTVTIEDAREVIAPRAGIDG